MNKISAVSILLVAILAVGFATNGSNTTAGPRVIARVNLTSQTEAIPVTTLFTPPSTGLFRVSEYTTVTAPGHNPQYNWSTFLYWTDESGSESAMLADLGDGQKPPTDYAVCGTGADCMTIIRATAGVPVSYSIADNSGATGVYDAFLVVEQLE
jgi:hypothetical protein